MALILVLKTHVNKKDKNLHFFAICSFNISQMPFRIFVLESFNILFLQNNGLFFPFHMEKVNIGTIYSKRFYVFLQALPHTPWSTSHIL